MLKSFSKLDYLLRETWVGLKRGGWLNWAAISTVTVLLLLFGLSLQASWQLEHLLNQFGNQLEVSVYLDPGAKFQKVVPLLSQLPEVVQVQEISREDAWQSLIKELGISDVEGATQQLEGNPLLDAIKIQAKESTSIPELAKKISRISGVDTVQYADEAFQELSQLNKGLSYISLAVTTILSLTSIAVITTTIRLIVIARRREIEIMQLVGATDIWIYLPFLLQGIFFGLVGAIFAWFLVIIIQNILGQWFVGQPDFLQFLVNQLQLTPWQQISLPLILMALGMSVGVMGSLFAVKRLAVR